jgi:hypothetical protein
MDYIYYIITILHILLELLILFIKMRNMFIICERFYYKIKNKVKQWFQAI